MSRVENVTMSLSLIASDHGVKLRNGQRRTVIKHV